MEPVTHANGKDAVPVLDDDLVKNIFTFLDIEEMPALCVLNKGYNEFLHSDHFWLTLVRKHCPAIEDQWKYLKDGSANGQSPKTLRELPRWRKTCHLTPQEAGSQLQFTPGTEFGVFFMFRHQSLPLVKAIFTDATMPALEWSVIVTPPQLPSCVFEDGERPYLHLSITDRKTGLQTTAFQGIISSVDDLNEQVIIAFNREDEEPDRFFMYDFFLEELGEDASFCITLIHFPDTNRSILGLPGRNVHGATLGRSMELLSFS